MLGYRCCSDWSELPADERAALDKGSRHRCFDAYVNVASLTTEHLSRLGRRYPDAKYIVCTPPSGGPPPSPDSNASSLVDAVGANRVLQLPLDHVDKWQGLCTFLHVPYPNSQYPAQPDRGVRPLRPGPPTPPATAYQLSNRHRADPTPWVIRGRKWAGLHAADRTGFEPARFIIDDDFRHLDPEIWQVRRDTFPSNLALFAPENVAVSAASGAQLTLTASAPPAIRDFASGAIASTQRFRYGRFSAELRPARLPGMITGIFLHRDLPRQEIDIEFSGRDTTRMLVNVYYNPGTGGARMQYGYRGAPSHIDLGFDAADDFHVYEIEWFPSVIRWRVDGCTVHERGVWNPTPIPDCSMEFNVNLWPSQSRQLAGRLDPRELPARSHVRAARIAAVEVRSKPMEDGVNSLGYGLSAQAGSGD